MSESRPVPEHQPGSESEPQPGAGAASGAVSGGSGGRGGADVLRDIAQRWRPGPEHSTDALDPGPSAALSAVLGLPEAAPVAGQPLPPLWQWLHFLHWPRRDELGMDGHPRDGRFLPPLTKRRRMFAGGRLEVHAPLTLGSPAEVTSSVSGVEVKEGRSGALLFVTVRGEYRQQGALCLTEEQDFVYRSGGGAPVPEGLVPDTVTAPGAGASWQVPWNTDPALLFRFSALTANAHRIHYDAPYTTDTEGYPGLVVHGPLLALSMLELVRREAPDRAVRALSYRLRKPVFCGERLLTCGEPGTEGAAREDRADADAGGSGSGKVRLWVASCREAAHATAEVTLA
ncbi:MaoC family dehydratase N-terminal domain-containing protein [Streptomyces sp. WMMB 322]|uniref:FAS1-like dehydratase domain-containing protein n=1 Tax=Streptomyces sp. WMMB 322 TaxID=1286821 RepID=UPI000823ADD1|nr:MaoC family dehydratase N-terminal domain-containing protein [Streptomyces sp. WMMB 322]SCK53544.1 3-methylfumaryl-CoA hydratase [Streptomyces sp. WMMB 322]